MPRIAVVGGGPSGFMAALTAASSSPGSTVDVFDAGVPLATILRTGGGRCNLTNALCQIRELAAHYPRGGSFLLSALSRFGTAEAMEWFQSRGLALVEEEEGRVFPRSGRAEDVRDLLASEARKLGVRVHARSPVLRAERLDQGFHVTASRAGGHFDRLVIATGGDRKEGEGSGYRLARSLGHSVTPLAPSLTGLVTAEPWPGTIAGLTMRGARLKAFFEGKQAADERGDLLFTHEGVSGPLAFRVSSRCAFLRITPRSPLHMELSALPDKSRDEIEESLIAGLAARPRQRVVSALRVLVPRSLADVVLTLAGVDPGLSGSQLAREKRKTIARLVDRLPLTVIARQKAGEMVTAGGIPVSEVDPRTMESRLAPGLYFCGEVLDIDGFTGGFNLQAAWSTGYLAGLAAGL
jgi:predicted Rossmann fold flavoprotein